MTFTLALLRRCHEMELEEMKMDWFFRSRRRFSVAGSAAVIFLVQVLVPVATRAAPFAYVANYGEGSISVIDAANNALVATVPVGSYPSSPVVNPAGTRLYVVGLDLSIIDTATNSVVAKLPGIGAPMAFDPSGNLLYDGKRLYVTDGFASTISVVGTLAGTEVVTLPGAGIVIGPENPPITPPPVPTETRTVTPTSTPAPAGCAGDCNGDKSVTVDEILRLVNIALGAAPLSDCSAGDADRDGGITVDDIMTAVNTALNGCGARPTPTP
jgi:YVTN family beta-propeller protein